MILQDVLYLLTIYKYVAYSGVPDNYINASSSNHYSSDVICVINEI